MGLWDTCNVATATQNFKVFRDSSLWTCSHIMDISSSDIIILAFGWFSARLCPVMLHYYPLTDWTCNISRDALFDENWTGQPCDGFTWLRSRSLLNGWITQSRRLPVCHQEALFLLQVTYWPTTPGIWHCNNSDVPGNMTQNQWMTNVDPTSQTVGQHQWNSGSISNVCWCVQPSLVNVPLYWRSMKTRRLRPVVVKDWDNVGPTFNQRWSNISHLQRLPVNYRCMWT